MIPSLMGIISGILLCNGLNSIERKEKTIAIINMGASIACIIMAICVR